MMLIANWQVIAIACRHSIGTTNYLNSAKSSRDKIGQWSGAVSLLHSYCLSISFNNHMACRKSLGLWSAIPRWGVSPHNWYLSSVMQVPFLRFQIIYTLFFFVEGHTTRYSPRQKKGHDIRDHRLRENVYILFFFVKGN
jgi:hypothetical protein